MESLSNKRSHGDTWEEVIPPSGHRAIIPKKLRQITHNPKPSLMLIHESSRHSFHDLSDLETNIPVEILYPGDDIPQTLNLSQVLAELSPAEPLLGLVLCFFGPSSYNYTTVLNTLEPVHPRIPIVGISAYVSANDNAFAVINDSQGLASKCFGTLDPLGGGVFPLDSMVVFDQSGANRLQVSILGGSRGICMRYNNQVTLKNSSDIARTGKLMVGVENLAIVVRECCEYIESTSLRGN
ncbi:hypothetical protein BABINDRAFT_162058 [Babjeviella inositovora NRRL Y-12698]|uniref:Uncharacterized protein n=1 Tax=Babjeviella inositovora NRRL Y-12698 TaxID=984486 RepID=A0A1E3QMR9_9ASCO|nr:uncharacterized protein BABINDRAFT_162058 [Babjeviella inositovora NRRL Y-12698]ODQ78973.1 hypothetical protein BABINDRAFT_162058 [Babjeviella inositovora NRRL Y-12698]